jgi:hypothetical protein
MSAEPSLRAQVCVCDRWPLAGWAPPCVRRRGLPSSQSVSRSWAPVMAPTPSAHCRALTAASWGGGGLHAPALAPSTHGGQTAWAPALAPAPRSPQSCTVAPLSDKVTCEGAVNKKGARQTVCTYNVSARLAAAGTAPARLLPSERRGRCPAPQGGGSASSAALGVLPPPSTSTHCHVYHVTYIAPLLNRCRMLPRER